jgi:putative DNA primase/helicase
MAALRADPNTQVQITEGEKDADTMIRMGFVATTNPGGALSWAEDMTAWLRTLGVRRAVTHEDNDEKGRLRTTNLTAALSGFIDLRVMRYPDVPAGEDVTWWLEHGHTKDELSERIAAAKAEAAGEELLSTRASEIEIRAYEWLWPERFALGKLALIAGLPDVGKGQTSDYLAARVSTGGAWPCGEGVAPLGSVIMLVEEDDAADTVVPRLMAAGADLTRIHFINMIRRAGAKRMFSLVTDLPLLRQKIETVGDVKLVIVDPITAYLGVGKVDSYRTTDVRGVLGPLVELIQEKRFSGLGVMHFNKKLDVTNALLRISDSLAFAAVARHCYAIIDDAEHERKLFVKAKNNIVRYGVQTLAYRFQVREVGVDKITGKTVSASYIVWDPEPVDVSASEAMEAANSDGANIAARDDAKMFLKNKLTAGPVKAADLKEEAEANLISERTLKRAKQNLRVVAWKEKSRLDGDWFWELPKEGERK